MSEIKSKLQDEIILLENLFDRCKDSKGHGGFSWGARKSLVNCIERIIDIKIELAFDAYKNEAKK